MDEFNWEGIDVWSDNPLHNAVLGDDFSGLIKDKKTREEFERACQVLRSFLSYLEDNDLIG